MPRPRKQTKVDEQTKLATTAPTVSNISLTVEKDTVTNNEINNVKVQRKSKRGKIIENDTINSKTMFSYQPQVKNVENMERIKSKIEMFDINRHKILLPAILITYGDNMNKALNNNEQTRNGGDFIQITKQNIIEEFKKQITENQNGIFLNLTCCSDELWQACVQCVEQMEKQYNNIEKLDKERQEEMERLRKNHNSSTCV